uniref:LigA n=1 Tax=Parastrongyloides trichosuri TaxID=131310 RepID=A0A0N4ZVQ3_PARTI
MSRLSADRRTRQEGRGLAPDRQRDDGDLGRPAPHRGRLRHRLGLGRGACRRRDRRADGDDPLCRRRLLCPPGSAPGADERRPVARPGAPAAGGGADGRGQRRPRRRRPGPRTGAEDARLPEPGVAGYGSGQSARLGGQSGLGPRRSGRDPDPPVAGHHPRARQRPDHQPQRDQGPDHQRRSRTVPHGARRPPGAGRPGAGNGAAADPGRTERGHHLQPGRFDDRHGPHRHARGQRPDPPGPGAHQPGSRQRAEARHVRPRRHRGGHAPGHSGADRRRPLSQQQVRGVRAERRLLGALRAGDGAVAARRPDLGRWAERGRARRRGRRRLPERGRQGDGGRAARRRAGCG